MSADTILADLDDPDGSGFPGAGRLRAGAGPRTCPATFTVNFHGIGTAPRAYDPGEEPFWLTEREFEASLDAVQCEAAGRRVSLTFDDGNVSDHAIAAPALVRRGLAAGFFIVAGRLGQAGFVSKAQVRDLATAGFEIGSHGFDHVDWTRMSDRELEHEVKDSKTVLEDVIGAAVRRAGIPFGRYDRRVLRALRAAGYAEVLSSDGGPRLTAAWPVPRRSMRHGITAADLPGLVAAGRGVFNRTCCEGRLRVKAALSRRQFV